MKSFFLLSSLLIVSLLPAQTVTNCQQQHNHTSAIAQPPLLMADTGRSDTIDILDIDISLNVTDFTTDTIRGGTSLRFTPLMNNVSEIDLDLLELLVDSVKIGSQVLTYTYNDTLLRVTLPAAMNPGDTNTVTVWYHGVPQIDATGWGGFYFQSGYAYNLGVGFGADPHNYGRVWFPCFDNFVERSTYTFRITSSNGKIAYCNGLLTGDTTLANNDRLRTWRLNETIPSYLASVSVSNYTHVHQTFNSVNGAIPVWLTALPTDTTNMKNSFLHLDNALHGFEARYFPYSWPRVGYCLVPFSSGAMEHATNISFPRLAANGALTYESDLMAHELSHHWWGDLATCRTPEDMWLNEGWATFSQSIFVEWVYGYAQYKNYRRVAHENVLHYAHINDNGYRAVSGVPHAYTYGDHVYQKGADVAHALRGYMGDTTFFNALHYHLLQSQYKDVSSVDFMNNLITSSGNNTLVDFFNDWVFSPGFPHFSIDSSKVTPNGQNWDVTIYVKQKLNHAPHYYNNVPLEVTFRDAQGNSDTRNFTMSGHLMQFTYTTTFQPSYSALNMEEKIDDAIIAESRSITGPGLQNLTLARCSLTVVNMNDSAFVRVEHNFAPPDSIVNNFNNYRISPYRYWKIDGMLPTTFYATAKLYYDGRNTTAGSGGHLDDDLTAINGDSIILLYRRNTADDWHEWPHYTKTRIGSAATSKYGYVVVDSVALGEYAFANGVSQVLIGVNEPELQPLSELEIFPNPSTGAFTVAYDAKSDAACRLECYDMTGRLIMGDSVSSSGHFSFPAGTLDAGSYIFILSDGKQRLAESRCVITKY